MNDQELEVVEKMGKYGGSFVKSLAQCFVHADRSNIDILKYAFRHYWEEYEKMAK